jgi:hypothetical protein
VERDGGREQDEGEEERGSQVGHGLSPYLSTGTRTPGLRDLIHSKLKQHDVHVLFQCQHPSQA